MKKRLWISALALMCCLLLLPAASMKALAAEEYELWVGGTQVTAANAADVFGDGKVSYDAAGRTLTLTGYSNGGAYYIEEEAGVYDAQHGYRIAAGIYYAGTEPLTLELVGENTLTMPAFSTDKLDNAAIFSRGELTVTGSGSLSAAGGAASDNDDESTAGSFGICCNGRLTVTGGTVTFTGGSAELSYGCYGECVTVTGGTAAFTGGQAKSDSFGIYCEKDISVTSGEVTVTGGAAERNSYGVYSYDGYERKNGEVVTYGVAVSGGRLTAAGGDAGGKSRGIYLEYSVLSLTGGELRAIGGAAGKTSYGLDGGIYSLNAEGGRLTALGGAATGANGVSCGIYSGIAPMYISGNAEVKAAGGPADVTGGESYGLKCGFIKISGGSLEASGGDAAAYSCGSHGKFAFSLAGGEVTAVGGAAEKSHGMFNDDDIEVSGGTVTASGGEAGESCGICLAAHEYEDGDVTGGTLTVTGGEVTARGGSCGVFCDPAFDGKVIVITGGTVTASGGDASMSKAPILGADVTAICSAAIDGSAPADYDESAIDTCRWLKTVGDPSPKTPVTALSFTVEPPVAGAEPAETVYLASVPEGAMAVAEYEAVWLESEDGLTYETMTSPIFEAGRYYAVELPDEKNAGGPLIALAASGYALVPEPDCTVNGEEAAPFLSYLEFFGPLEAVSYGIGTDPAEVRFTAGVGYSEEDYELYHDIVASNTGEGEVTFIMAGFKESSMYERFGLIVGGMTATVYPRAGLTEGTYTAAVILSDLYDRFEPVEVPVTLAVKPAGSAAVPALIPNNTTTAVEQIGYLEIDAVEGQEYALASGSDAPDWTSPIEPTEGRLVLSNLSGGTEYTLYTRVAETEDTAPGAAAATPFVTTVSSYGWTAAADPEVIGATVFADFDAEAELSYRWYRCDDGEGANAAEISSETGAEFTVPEALEGSFFFARAFIGDIEVGSFYPLGPVTFATVSFDSRGGSAVESLAGLTAGTALTRPESTCAGRYLEGWYLDEDYKEAWSFETDVIRSAELTLYAKWSSVPVHAIEGVVYASDGMTPMPGITVTLTRADANLGDAVTDADGRFSFSAVAGMYNIVAYDEAGNLTKTELVELAENQTLAVVMPEAGRSSVLANWNAGDYAATVGGLDEIAAGIALGAGESVTVMLSVTAGEQMEYAGLTDEEKADFASGKAAIQAMPEIRGRTVEYFCLTLEKTVTDGDSEITMDIGDGNTQLLTVIIPFETDGRSDITVFRCHGTEAAAMTPNPAAGEEGFTLGNGSITLYARAFSAYAIAYVCHSEEEPEAYTPAASPAEQGTVSEKPFFADVPEDSYYYDAVNWAVENGIAEGTGETTFSPQAACTRAQTITFIWRAAGKPEPGAADIPFTDLEENAYYLQAVLWAYENGITTGTGETTFSPDDTVTRSQAVTFLFRALGGGGNADIPFTDVEKSAYYFDAVSWAFGQGITDGTGETTFSPENDCLREQIVTFLYRAYHRD